MTIPPERGVGYSPAVDPTTTSVHIALRGAQVPVHVAAWDTEVPGLVVVNSTRFNASTGGTRVDPRLFAVVHAYTGKQVGGVWSSLANAITAAVAVHTALHIDWTGHIDPAVANAVQLQFNRVHDDLRDWPVGRPVKVSTPLRRAGDNRMADAVVVCTVGGVRYLLLGEREDGAGWAIPGGSVEDGETTEAAARRELLEETGLDSTGVHAWQLTQSMPVDDPRNTPDRRAVTDLFLFVVEPVDGGLPAVRAGDDLTRVAWFASDNRGDVTRAVVDLGGFLFRPHPQLLSLVADELRILDAVDAYFEANIRDSWRGVDPDEVEHQKGKYRRDVRVNAAATRQVLEWFNRPGGRVSADRR